MRRLIEAGVPGDVNMRTDYGRTILHNNVRRSVKYNTPRKSENSVAQFQKKHKIWKGNVEYLISPGRRSMPSIRRFHSLALGGG